MLLSNMIGSFSCISLAKKIGDISVHHLWILFKKCSVNISVPFHTKIFKDLEFLRAFIFLHLFGGVNFHFTEANKWQMWASAQWIYTINVQVQAKSNLILNFHLTQAVEFYTIQKEDYKVMSDINWTVKCFRIYFVIIRYWDTFPNWLLCLRISIKN